MTSFFRKFHKFEMACNHARSGMVANDVSAMFIHAQNLEVDHEKSSVGVQLFAGDAYKEALAIIDPVSRAAPVVARILEVLRDDLGFSVRMPASNPRRDRTHATARR